MAEVGFDDFEMQDSCKTFSFYDNMDHDQLVHEYYDLQDLLTDGEFVKKNPEQSREYGEIHNYLEKLIRQKKNESSFIESHRGKTVNIEKNPFESTSWIDYDINYQPDGKGVISTKGEKDSIKNFIGNIFIQDGNFREN